SRLPVWSPRPMRGTWQGRVRLLLRGWQWEFLVQDRRDSRLARGCMWHGVARVLMLFVRVGRFLQMCFRRDLAGRFAAEEVRPSSAFSAGGASTKKEKGGDFIKNDEPQGNQVFCPMNECIPEVVKGEEAWKAWKAGQCGNISLSHGLIEFTNTHQKNKGAFLTFQKDADQIYPGWKEKLGYTGESSVQAASFDWAKKA
ncbi:rbcL, partial [Symbiodinium sp. KB8]